MTLLSIVPKDEALPFDSKAVLDASAELKRAWEAWRADGMSMPKFERYQNASMAWRRAIGITLA